MKALNALCKWTWLLLGLFALALWLLSRTAEGNADTGYSQHDRKDMDKLVASLVETKQDCDHDDWLCVMGKAYQDGWRPKK